MNRRLATTMLIGCVAFGLGFVVAHIVHRASGAAGSSSEAHGAPWRSLEYPAGKVTVNGTAANAKLGAVVLADSTDGIPVFIEGLSEWPTSDIGSRIQATGDLVVVVRNRDLLSPYSAHEPPLTFALRNAKVERQPKF